MSARDLSFERVVAFAADLIRIPSLPGNEGDVVLRVRHELEELGFRDVRIDELGNVIGVAPGRGAAPAVMLSSHLDMVDVGDPASWEYPPFGGIVDGGFLHGRGAMDIKGPLALQTYAAAHFLDHPAEGDVVVAHTVFEERGGWGMDALMRAGTLRPGAVILGEATNGDVCIGHRGRAELIIEAQGVAGHASAPERARNPLDALPSIIPALQEFAAQLPSAPVLGKATLAPTALETLPRSRNVIPDRARVIVDWRTLPGPSAENARRALEDFLRPRVRLPDGCALDIRFATEHQRTFTGLERDRDMFTPGYLLPADHPVAVAAARAVRTGLGREPALRAWTFATDGGHTCGEHGIPTIGFAPGEERFAHTNRERLDLAQARAVYDAYPLVIRAVMDAA
ncbi:MAG TPA: M20/M25/M40 family metallo-hydrolase [Longimicrobiales bacterium]|nr:M20/M25/M40 family metallo-hydrolase [Longimicrobiales bacterium]